MRSQHDGGGDGRHLVHRLAPPLSSAVVERSVRSCRVAQQLVLHLAASTFSHTFSDLCLPHRPRKKVYRVALYVCVACVKTRHL